MFNLLPAIQKEKIRTEYKLHLVTVILILVIFLEISFLILLLPSWVISYFKEKELLLNEDAANHSSIYKKAEETQAVIVQTNAKLKILNTAMEYPKLGHLVNSVISNKTSDIYINQFSYTSAGQIASMSITGISNTRESLVLFIKNLQSSGSFKEVNLPVSNFAKDKNIDFSINLNITSIWK